MSYKMTGVIYAIGETQQVSDKFAKREIILADESSQYPQHINFQFTQKKCEELDGFAKGQIVEISFNLRGRIWVKPGTTNEQCFNSLEGWKIEVEVGSQPLQAAPQQVDEEEPPY